jgi:hydroxymethylpyrimidine/phosphomethylpyrimidine kinase
MKFLKNHGPTHRSAPTKVVINRKKRNPSVLILAGIDPTGHAGLFRDQEICRQATTPFIAIPTALTLQNDKNYWQTLPVPAKTLQKMLDDINPKSLGAIKMGMLVNEEIVKMVVRFIRHAKKQNPKIKTVWDPVFKSSSGGILLDTAGQKLAIKNLWPLVDLVTPNAIEAQILSGKKIKRNGPKLAENLYLKKHVAIYLKGGHTAQKATDYFHDGALQILSGPVSKAKLRGTGCTLATIIAGILTKEVPLADACFQAKNTMRHLFSKKNH